MLQAKFRITGTDPLLMHCDCLADPLHELTKEYKKFTSKRKKTDEDHLMISKLEWKAGMYRNDDGPILPGRMIKAMLVRAATKTKDGPKVRSGVQVVSSEMPVQYRGPRDLEGMWKSGKFTDKRSVVVSRSRTIRTRPKFMEWSIDVTLAFDENVVDPADLLRFFETGGLLVGLGDYRPENGGDFGRFQVEAI